MIKKITLRVLPGEWKHTNTHNVTTLHIYLMHLLKTSNAHSTFLPSKLVKEPITIIHIN